MATKKPETLPEPQAGGRYIRHADGSLEQVQTTEDRRSRRAEREEAEPEAEKKAPAAPAPTPTPKGAKE